MGRTTFSGPVKSTNGIEVGSAGTQITLIKRGTVSVNLDSLATTASGETSITITGAVVGDTVILNPPSTALTAGLIIGQAYVSAADTVKVRVLNSSGDTINEAAATWSYCLIRS